MRRLLGIATLTPAQAAHVMVEVLALLQPESESYGAFDADDVLIDEDGSIRIAPHGFTPGTAAAAAELAGRLARNADRPAARNRPAQAALLTVLAQCAQNLATGDLAGALTELRRELEAMGADDARLRGELAALVAVPLVRVGAEPAAAPTSDGLPQVAAAADVSGSAPPDGAATRGDEGSLPPAAGRVRRIPPRALVPAVAVAVLAVVAIILAVLSGNSSAPKAGSSAPPALHHRHSSSPSPVAPVAGNRPRPVHRPAPLAAGPVSRVTLTPAHTCAPGAACPVTLKVWLRPPGLSRLTWRAALVDRCTGQTRTIDTGSMIAEPGWHAPYTDVRLRLPKKGSMALMAVVSAPVSAASRPLLVPAGGGRCG